MRAVRAHDGAVYQLDDRLPPNVTLEGLHAVLSELSNIPVTALIVMHPTGRQVDRETLHGLVAGASNAGSVGVHSTSSSPGFATDTATDRSSALATKTVYLFDREVIELNLDSQDGQQVLASMDLDYETCLAESANDPNKELEVCLDIIDSIRHQRASISAALINLERHRGGRQEAINAYNHFASPLLSQYRSLLAVYPASISLVAKVKVSSKMKNHRRQGDARQESAIADFVSKDKMESVKDGCRRTLEEIERKDETLETILRTVKDGTEQLKREANENNLDDLDECERDAKEAHARSLQLMQTKRTTQEEQEYWELEEDVRERLRYLVDRKNVETRQLISSLQRIAELQSLVADTPKHIANLNNDLKTRCDGFKHLGRLQLLVPSYVATLAETIRRQLFGKLLATSSRSFAEVFSKLTADEKKRRGLYQAEWAGKLPWEVPGLEEAMLGVEVELRRESAGSQAEQNKGQSQELTLEDLEELGRCLADVEDGLSPEDMPAGGVAHPIKEAISLVEKLKKQIAVLQDEFEKLTAKFDDSAESDVTSVNIPATDHEGLRLLEEKRVELERELQAERSAREQETAELNVKIAELTKANSELLSGTKNTESQSAALQKDLKKEQGEKARLLSRLETVSSEAEVNKARSHTLFVQVEILETDVKGLREARGRLEEENIDMQDAIDRLHRKEGELEAALEEKERLYRKYQAEAEMDKATLEKELHDVEERSAEQIRSVQARLESAETNLSALREGLSGKEDELAELQVMCNERGKSLELAKSALDASALQISELLLLFKTVYEPLAAYLVAFISTPIAIVPSAIPGESEKDPAEAALSFSPFDATSMENAVASLRRNDQPLVARAKEKTDTCIYQVKKWQKECKRYKERSDKAVRLSREKLAFRRFEKNDLALFLPTRDSNLQVFAAFNFGRPNYFLTPTGVIAEQIKSREWIVARITNIAEAVVDASTPSNNPYSLSVGSKYFMLEAEPWRKESAPQIKDPPSESGQSPVAQHRRASTSDIPRNPIAEDAAPATLPPPAESPTHSKTPTQASVPLPSALDKAESEFSLIEPGAESASHRPSLLKTTSAPASGPSSLSLQRPANLDAVPELAAVANSSAEQLQPLQTESSITLDTAYSSSMGEATPAFLPVSTTAPRRVIRSSTSPKLGSTAIPRSFSSSNDSNSSLHRRMVSSHFLTNIASPKAPATTSTSTSADDTDKHWPSPSSTRQTQTIGRYASKKTPSTRRQTSSYSGMVSQASAADLLRSFTDSI